MGDVAITYKVMPEGVDVDLGALKEAIQGVASEYGQVAGLEEKPIAFGLKAVMVTIVMPDKESKPDELEQKLEGIDKVESVNTENLTLI